jgi:hypothetical protein
MAIGDVRPQDPSNYTTPPAEGLDQDIMKKMMNQMIKTKRRAMIKGEMRMMEIKEKHHHIQECVTMFKEITSSTTYLVILKRG